MGVIGFNNNIGDFFIFKINCYFIKLIKFINMRAPIVIYYYIKKIEINIFYNKNTGNKLADYDIIIKNKYIINIILLIDIYKCIQRKTS